MGKTKKVFSTFALRKVSTYLKSRIFGQDHIIDEMLDLLYVNMAGLSDQNKPIASLLFTGPTGVGKTELTKELASFLDMDLVRFDMSEYADEYSARNLTGGQKGLVGYEEGGLLTNAIKEKPRSVLLLDEIEKADKAVYNSFLQVLDYGKLTDTKGNTVDFSQTIIIMTSNLGSKEQRGIGFGENQNIHKGSAVLDFLTPEFRNRIDKMLEFEPLNREVSTLITNKYVGDFIGQLAKQNINLEVTDKASTQLNQIGFESTMGARSVIRAISNHFKQKISREILFGKLSNGGNVVIDIEEDGFIYHITSHEEDKNANIVHTEKKNCEIKIKKFKLERRREKKVLTHAISEAEKVEILLFALKHGLQ